MKQMLLTVTEMCLDDNEGTYTGVVGFLVPNNMDRLQLKTLVLKTVEEFHLTLDHDEDGDLTMDAYDFAGPILDAIDKMGDSWWEAVRIKKLPAIEFTDIYVMDGEVMDL